MIGIFANLPNVGWGTVIDYVNKNKAEIIDAFKNLFDVSEVDSMLQIALKGLDEIMNPKD